VEKMKLYMAVTKDEYEHSIYIESIAKKLNMRTDSLLRRIWRGGNGRDGLKVVRINDDAY
jgi:hypothetical protein